MFRVLVDTALELPDYGLLERLRQSEVAFPKAHHHLLLRVDLAVATHKTTNEEDLQSHAATTTTITTTTTTLATDLDEAEAEEEEASRWTQAKEAPLCAICCDTENPQMPFVAADTAATLAKNDKSAGFIHHVASDETQWLVHLKCAVLTYESNGRCVCGRFPKDFDNGGTWNAPSRSASRNEVRYPMNAPNTNHECENASSATVQTCNWMHPCHEGAPCCRLCNCIVNLCGGSNM